MLLGLVVIATQTSELLHLRRDNQALQKTLTDQHTSPAPIATPDDLSNRLAELQSLRAEIDRLAAETEQLAEMKKQNEALRAQLAEVLAKPNIDDPFAAAKAKAERNQCIQQIKQIGLCARIWANDNSEIFPPAFLAMTNELLSPKLLTCPSDSQNLPPADSWNGFDPGKVSYEWLGANHSETDPDEVIVRCRIHANAGTADGAAHQLDLRAIEYFNTNGVVKFRRKASAPPISYE
jgi:hypothetical protein